MFLLAACSKQVTDMEGRPLPAEGATVKLIEKHGWLPKDEAAVSELMVLPKIDLQTDPAAAGRQIDEAVGRNAERLIKEGRLIQVTPGIGVRVLSYYAGEDNNIRPLTSEERVASWVQVEILDGDSKQQTGFTTADGIQ
jgi:hypothetical protein